MAATWSKKGIWEVVEEALAHPRCICGCGRWCEENTFSTPECFNKEEPEIVHC